MLVKDLMTTTVYTVTPDDSIDRVFFLMHYKKVRHLPVLENNKVIGIVSDRDLHKALVSNLSSETPEPSEGSTSLHVIPKKVQHIMHHGVISVTADTGAAQAAAIMAENKIGALPVTDQQHKLTGIISSIDILKLFAETNKKSDAPSS